MFAYATTASYDSRIYHIMSNSELGDSFDILFWPKIAIDEVRNSNNTSLDQQWKCNKVQCTVLNLISTGDILEALNMQK